MNDVVAVVQFLHPGNEHQARHDRNGGKTWNINKFPHERCYLVSYGAYVNSAATDDRSKEHGEICFWGEWEPEAQRVMLIPEPVYGEPRALYRPLYRSPCSFHIPRHNTDPFVFGERFLYTNCLQHKYYTATNTWRPTQLRCLARGSIILFGSCKNKHFWLDTVFVVAGHIDHDALTFHNIIEGGTVPDAFTDATLCPLYQQPRRHSSAYLPVLRDAADLRTFRLYYGATYDEPVDGMFSFFPCLPRGQGGEDGFTRPVIHPVGVLDRVIKPTMTQNYKTTQGLGTDERCDIWREVVRQVLEQECYLGVHASLPTKIP